jgi:hypothetical protein
MVLRTPEIIYAPLARRSARPIRGSSPPQEVAQGHARSSDTALLQNSNRTWNAIIRGELSPIVVLPGALSIIRSDLLRVTFRE